MFKYNNDYWYILKNGLEDWLYVFNYCNFFFYNTFILIYKLIFLLIFLILI